MPSKRSFDDGPTGSDIQTRPNEGRRKPLTVTVPEELQEEARDVAYHEEGVTVSGLVEEGLRRVLGEREDVPPRPEGEQLPSGPPPKS
jgi:hypothetical protein